MKKPWQSKTLWFNFAKALVVLAIPGADEYLLAHPEVFIAADAIISILLRLLTKEPVEVKKVNTINMVVLIALLAGCSSVQQKLDPQVFYKRDIEIEINGEIHEGVTVVPQSDSYRFVFTPKGNIDLILLRTCHREFSGEKLSSGWFQKGKFKYEYKPVIGIEDSRVCPMRIDAYESDKGRHSWALVEFEHTSYRLQAELTCNGKVNLLRGVGVCQAKSGTVQRLRFFEPVRFSPPKPEQCGAPVKKGNWYEIEVTPGECLYHFDSKDGKIGRLTMVGYQGVLVREAQ